MHIVHVDDHEDFRLLISEALTSMGHEVTQTATVADAWQAIQRHEGAVVICDRVLPDGDGVGLIERLRAAGRKDTFVLMSAYVEEETESAAKQAGADFVLEKPVSLDGFEQALARLLPDTPAAA